MDSKVVLVIVCVVILILIGVGIYCYYKFFVPSDEDDNKALAFIKGYQSVFEEIIQSVIDDLDLSNYSSIIDYELDVFVIAYNKCWDYIEEQLTAALENSSIGRLVAKCVTKENVEMIVELIINTFFTKTIEAKYTERWEETSAEAEKEEERLQHEADLYETEQIELPEYVEEEKVIDMSNIIAPTDYEEPYNPEDIGMEILDEADYEVEGQMSFDDLMDAADNMVDFDNDDGGDNEE